MFFPKDLIKPSLYSEANGLITRRRLLGACSVPALCQGLGTEAGPALQGDPAETRAGVMPAVLASRCVWHVPCGEAWPARGRGTHQLDTTCRGENA